jgi:hypothetical protein
MNLSNRKASIRNRPACSLLLAAACGGLFSAGAAPPAPRPQLINRKPVVPTRNAASPTDSLEQAWPGYPEALAMFAEIVAGNPEVAGRGWFRKGVSQTRFDWKSVSGRLDRNGDGMVARAEIKASDEDFRRLDRDRDGQLTASDFDFLGDARPEAIGVLFMSSKAFNNADRNGDSRVTRRESDEMIRFAYSDPLIRVILTRVSREIGIRFDLAEKAGVGFLTLSDFQEAFTRTMKADMLSGFALPRMVPMSQAEQQAMLRAFLRGELGSMRPGPALDASAPDFTLSTVDGRSEVTLSKLYPTKPVVLIFGNFTCGPFRNHAGSLDILRKRYADRAHFVMVYCRESHPSDGWQRAENVASKVVLPQPRDYRERVDLAQSCRKTLGLEMPVLIDRMDDRVATRYSGLPSRLYLIDRQGKIAYKGGRAPYGFKPAELEQSLLLLLDADSSRTTDPPSSPTPPAAR